MHFQSEMDARYVEIKIDAIAFTICLASRVRRSSGDFDLDRTIALALLLADSRRHRLY